MDTTLFWTSYGILWAVTGLIAFTVILLLRHHGHVALQSRSSRDTQGPAVGELLPEVSLATEDGDKVSIERASIGPALVFIAGANCRACTSAIENLKTLSVSPAVTMAVVCLGKAEDCETFGKQLPQHFIRFCDPSHKASARWHISSTPFMLVIDSRGFVRGKSSSTGLDALEGLLEKVSAQTRTLPGSSAVSTSIAGVA